MQEPMYDGQVASWEALSAMRYTDDRAERDHRIYAALKATAPGTPLSVVLGGEAEDQGQAGKPAAVAL